ncbi:alpha/beta-Hydrolases superfamily protein [Actinidia rufa]|uniref:Alpha/beta-Hydrolases superfamily protein n=1 Tax=Actinidia rufa TaxID=165716 RepID=A0A7J0FIJ1_9ERIC|nr:alpha/beta-Hydrolases superfamily protein [Actinidia rufa]
MVSYVNVLLYGVGGIVVAGMALLVAFQERLVYVPVLPGLTKSYPITPARLRLIYEDVWLRSSDGVRLHAWFIKLLPDCKDIAHRLEMVRIMLQRLQCNVFMLSYRGYGDSDGYPSQHGITWDAQAALDHLVQRTDIDTSRIIVFGRSLGGAVGALLTKNNPEKVLEPAPRFLTFLFVLHGVRLMLLVRFNNRSFSYLDCKMKWFLHHTCKCYMLKQLHITGDAPLWSSLLACIWTHGWLAVIAIGERFNCFFEQYVPENKDGVSSQKDQVLQRSTMMNLPVMSLIPIQGSRLGFKTIGV